MDKVTVIQADRDAAASVINLTHIRRDIRAGVRDDHPAVQAFAAHRLATPAPDSEKLREALTPSGATKAAYLGEFKFDVMFPSLDEDDDEPVPHPVTVPWDTIKEIMAAISNRAALGASA